MNEETYEEMCYQNVRIFKTIYTVLKEPCWDKLILNIVILALNIQWNNHKTM